MNEHTSNIKKIANDSYFERVELLLAEGKAVKIPVKGISMFPSLKEGDQVRLKSTDMRDVKWGTIVLARYQGRYILHRLVGRKGDVLELAGDNNWVQIERVDCDAVIGTAAEAYRGGDLLRIYSTSSMQKAWLRYKFRPLRRMWGALFNKIKSGR